MISSQDSQPPRPPERVEQEAIAWFTRMNGEPSTGDHENFNRWRNADPAHERAYRDVSATWASTDAPGERVAAEEADTLSGYLDAIGRNRHRRRKLNGRIATFTTLLVLVLGFTIWLEHPDVLQNLAADHVTERGQRGTVMLADGTVVMLDAGSALTEQMDGDARRVRLLRGAAYFDVVPTDRPFIVEAGQGETRVTGTAFSVELRDDDTVVTLARGGVGVSSHADHRKAMLEPTQSVSYGSAGLGPIRQVSLDDALAWRDGRLIFENARLEDIVSQIGRYRAGRIIILGSGLSRHRVSGNLPLDDPNAALASLQATVGFRMNGIGGRLTIIGP